MMQGLPIRHPVFAGKLGLRIDVDFPIGLRRGVPFMLDLLARHGMKATFFIVAGRNGGMRALRRLIQPSYLRRYLRMGGWRLWVMSSVGGAGQMRLRDHASLVRRILDEGHEVGVHGYDHAWWADCVWSAGTDRIESQMARGFEMLTAVTKRTDLAWASPNWRTSDAVLHALMRRNVPYFSECWGVCPFAVRLPDGRSSSIPNLPVTVPSLEVASMSQRLEGRQAVKAVLDRHEPDGYNVVACHDYYEGMLKPELFRSFLEGCAARALRVLSLRELAGLLRAEGYVLPVGRIGRRRLPGFVGQVSWQEEET
jgi:undecaprenyl phosphate-alpha-L-ara4FN deformylase